MNVRNILAKKRDFMVVLMAIALIACLLSGCGSSTGAHAGITRLDDEGYLYYMDYTKDYYGKDVMDAMRKVGFILAVMTWKIIIEAVNSENRLSNDSTLRR